MSLGVYSFRLSVTTKSRRAISIAPSGDFIADLLFTEDGRPLLTQDLKNIALQQSISIILLTQSNDAIVTQRGELIDTVES
jgi:hypothetical protein